MSTDQGTQVIPQWTLGDRLRKARQETGLTVREFADEIGVSAKTITDAEGDRRTSRKILLNAYAMRTGVPREWLETGQVTSPDNGPNDGMNIDLTTRHDGTCGSLRHLTLAA